MKRRLFPLVAALLCAIPLMSRAAALSENKLYVGEKFTISGSDFGSGYDDYSAICFNDDSHCILGSSFYGTGYSWADAKITIAMPEWADISGNVIVYANENGYSVKKASLAYSIKPYISEVDDFAPRPGDEITITGTGFGDHGGSVYFGSYKGQVENWSADSVKVKVPSGIAATTKGMKLTSYNGNSVSYGSLSVSIDSSDDPLSNYQAEIFQAINLNKAWKITTGSKKVVVAVIDEGIYINHPDLKDNIWVNAKETIGNGADDDHNGYIDDRYGWDFLSNEGEMTTRGNHGTMVAGIIGAVGNNNAGVAGVNWNVSLMSLIACDEKTGCSKSAIIKAIRYAADNGADIINLSLGSEGVSAYTDDFNDAVKYAYSRGVTIVAAAGNGDMEGGIGQDLDFIPQSPVCNDNGQNMVIGVGALARGGESRASWSNYGKCVDVYAPGVDIVSTAVPAYSSLNGFYDIGSGTSFSAPLVSGVTALLKAEYPSISNAEIANRIIGTAGSNGLLNAYAALSEPYEFSPRPDGTLIRAAGTADIYLIKDGKKCLIPDYGTFTANGFKDSDVIDISSSEMSQYQAGSFISAPISDGALIKTSGSSDVYIVKYAGSKKFKRLILSPSVFKSYGHLKWENIITVSQDVMDSFAISNLARAAGDARIYELYPDGDTGQKRLVPSSAVFAKLGLDYDSIYEINGTDRDSYVAGADLG